MYNGLIVAHTKLKQPIEAEKVLREMIEAGLKPDVVSITSVIDAYRKTKDYDKCWDLYYTTDFEFNRDEFLISLMIRIWGATHDAEKGLKFFYTLETIGFTEHAEPYNAVIFALASRKTYARKAIEMYRRMQKSRVVPDYHTFTGVLKATSHIGDVPTACEVLETMKNLGFEMTAPIYNGLIRTYAGAWILPNAKEEHIELFVQDAWNLIEQMKEKDIPINVFILNNMLLLHKNALFTQEVHEKVLPLYEKYRIDPNLYTYQNLIQLYEDMGENGLVIETYERMIQLGIEPNHLIMRNYLLASIKVKHMDRIVDWLKWYKERDIFPPDPQIRVLSKIKNPPDSLFIALKALPKRFGQYREEYRSFTPPSKRTRSFKQMGKKTGANKRTKKKGL